MADESKPKTELPAAHLSESAAVAGTTAVGDIIQNDDASDDMEEDGQI